KKGLGEKEESVALTVQQVREILNDEFLDPKMPQARTINKKLEMHNAFNYQLISLILWDLLPNQNWREIGIWYLKTHCGLNRVGNFMKDIGQKVKVKLPEEDAIIKITGHKSSQGVRAFKSVNGSQKINTMKTLINTIELVSNINPINQESFAVLTKIIGYHINFNTNTIAMQNINMVQGVQGGEFQNQHSISNNCQLQMLHFIYHNNFLIRKFFRQ
ncbi:25189_t:CDS:2, partial [Gigaspora rosea]